MVSSWRMGSWCACMCRTRVWVLQNGARAHSFHRDLRDGAPRISSRGSTCTRPLQQYRSVPAPRNTPLLLCPLRRCLCYFVHSDAAYQNFRSALRPHSGARTHSFHRDLRYGAPRSSSRGSTCTRPLQRHRSIPAGNTALRPGNFFTSASPRCVSGRNKLWDRRHRGLRGHPWVLLAEI